MASRISVEVVNLGGEGEVSGVLNQQRPAALSTAWRSCRGGATLQQLAQAQHDFLVCDNTDLAIMDGSVDMVITNDVPIDNVVLGDPGISSREIRRILCSGGRWLHNGEQVFTNP